MPNLKTPEELVAEVHARLKPIIDVTMAKYPNKKYLFLKTCLGGYILGLADAFQELTFNVAGDNVTEEEGTEYLEKYYQQLRTLETYVEGLLGPAPGETK